MANDSTAYALLPILHLRKSVHPFSVRTVRGAWETKNGTIYLRTRGVSNPPATHSCEGVLVVRLCLNDCHAIINFSHNN